jgi:hypothetical protein
MVTMNIVECHKDAMFTKDTYYAKTIEEAKNLVYVIVSYSSDDSETSQSEVDYLYDNLENLIGTKEDPFVCELFYVDEADTSYCMEVWQDQKKFCDC